jgi:hypothetical protein
MGMYYDLLANSATLKQFNVVFKSKRIITSEAKTGLPMIAKYPCRNPIPLPPSE